MEFGSRTAPGKGPVNPRGDRSATTARSDPCTLPRTTVPNRRSRGCPAGIDDLHSPLSPRALSREARWALRAVEVPLDRGSVAVHCNARKREVARYFVSAAPSVEAGFGISVGCGMADVAPRTSAAFRTPSFRASSMLSGARKGTQMVSAHEIEVFIPEDHRLTVEVPRSVRSGPARLILLVASEDMGKSQDPKALERWRALSSHLAADLRPFDELSLDERRIRLREVMGAGRGISSSSEEFARQKSTEIDIEERLREGSRVSGVGSLSPTASLSP